MMTYTGNFEVKSRSNPDYEPVGLGIGRVAAGLRVTPENQGKVGKSLGVVLDADDLEVLADGLEKMQETARFTSPNMMRLSVDLATNEEVLSVSYVANSACFMLTIKNPFSEEKTEQAEAWLSTGETTAFIANARLFAKMLRLNAPK